VQPSAGGIGSFVERWREFLGGEKYLGIEIPFLSKKVEGEGELNCFC
jgi:hypothetical protein